VDASDWDARYDRDELVWTAEPNRFLVAETGGLSPGRAIDLACGEGRNAVWLATRGWEVTAVDFSTVALAKAARLAAARGVEIARVHADLRAYVPEPGGFDLVLVFYLQVPEAERTPLLRRAAAAVAPAGTLLVVAHDRTNLTNGYGGPPDAAVLYSPDETRVVVEGTGLHVERAEHVERPVVTDDGERVAIDCLVRASRAA
jgi:SAM-dependent methyltransferase